MRGAREQHVSPLVAMLYPAYTRRCEHCGGYVAMPAEDVIRRASEAVMEPLAALARSMAPGGAGGAGEMSAHGRWGGGWGAGQLASAYAGTWPGWQHGHHGHHAHHDDCGCRDCHGDDCACRCCIGDADLVVRARLGERRIVPVTIDNDSRRERAVTLQLSEFTSRGGTEGLVEGRLLSPAELTLGPCEHRQVVIGLDVTPEPQRPTPTTPGKRGEKPDEERRGEGDDEGRRPDVDDCVVVYGDLRIAGCDVRPVRIAVAVLPRHCHPYPVDCGCGCC